MKWDSNHEPHMEHEMDLWMHVFWMTQTFNYLLNSCNLEQSNKGSRYKHYLHTL